MIMGCGRASATKGLPETRLVDFDILMLDLVSMKGLLIMTE